MAAADNYRGVDRAEVTEVIVRRLLWRAYCSSNLAAASSVFALARCFFFFF